MIRHVKYIFNIIRDKKALRKKLAKIDKMHIHQDLSRSNVTTE